MNDELLIARANAIGAAAVGREMAVRLDKKTHIRGRIVSAAFHHFGYSAASRRVVWEVVLEAGSAKALHTVRVAVLPRM